MKQFMYNLIVSIKNFIISMLSKYGKISSKRFLGTLTTVVILIAFLHCVYTHTEMPEATYALISYAAVLLGIETVFSKKGTTNDSQQQSEQSQE